MQTIRLIGRSSRLSLLQVDLVKQKIQAAFPHIQVEVITRSSKGDALQNVPLHTVEGSDFFTQYIFDALANGEADIAIHSLKDMSSEHFFGANRFAVVDRDDKRDVAIFHADVPKKISKGEKIIIGTCSPRREEMATVFLQQALPQLHSRISIHTKPIRGNVETRLRKLDAGEYDATILATAGLNRLLRSKEDAGLIRQLLADKKIMLLPLIECVPAPCQGAIVAEAHFANDNAIGILQAIDDEKLLGDCIAEKREAVKYGIGCLQQFGVTSIDTKNGNYIYAAGKDAAGTVFEKWKGLPGDNLDAGNLFTSTDAMKSFFDYKWYAEEIRLKEQVVFVANYKAVQGASLQTAMGDKTILAAGTKTWLELARQGYWVTASADALGFEFLLPALQMPLLNIQAHDIVILTHSSAAERWQAKGYKAVSNYSLIASGNKDIKERISKADSIFWSSYAQYEFYGRYAKPGAQHICCGGETAALLKQAGVEPVLFPTIKSFQQWRNYSTRSHSVA